nr:hypothetical protein Iba_chr01bCG3460 [Ipomoea batatas]
MAGRDDRKSKGRGTDDAIPEDRARTDKGLLAKVKAISKFQSTIEDSHPAEGTEEVQTSSDDEAEPLGNPSTQLDSAQAKEKPEHADESTESSSFNDSGDEAQEPEQTL